VLVLALGYFTFDKFVLAPHREAALVAAASGSAAAARAEGSDTTASSAAPPGSIAVLPFVNMSADPENDFFDGNPEKFPPLARIERTVVGRNVIPVQGQERGSARDRREAGRCERPRRQRAARR
jgi:TolB-like protein